MPRPADDWWADVERDLLDSLDDHGTTSLETLARRLRIPEHAVTSLVAMLAREGKVRISVVERAGPVDGAA